EPRAAEPQIRTSVPLCTNKKAIFHFRQDFQAAIWIGIQRDLCFLRLLLFPSLVISGSHSLVFEQEATEATEETKLRSPLTSQAIAMGAPPGTEIRIWNLVAAVPLSGRCVNPA